MKSITYAAFALAFATATSTSPVQAGEKEWRTAASSCVQNAGVATTEGSGKEGCYVSRGGKIHCTQKTPAFYAVAKKCDTAADKASF